MSPAQKTYVSAHHRKMSEEDEIEEEKDSTNRSDIGDGPESFRRGIRRRIYSSDDSDGGRMSENEYSSDENGEDGAAWNRAKFKAQLVERIEEGRGGSAKANDKKVKSKKRKKTKGQRFSTSASIEKRFESFMALNVHDVVSV